MKNIKKNLKIDKGFVMIFSILISTIFLVISLAITNVALKETNFSISGKDTNDAFFAADAGAECALFYDRSDKNVFALGITPNMYCAGHQVDSTLSGSNPAWSYTFVVYGLGSNNQGCAKVTVNKDNRTPPAIKTQIISDGFNMGDALCNSTNQNRVVRRIQVDYGR